MVRKPTSRDGESASIVFASAPSFLPSFLPTNLQQNLHLKISLSFMILTSHGGKKYISSLSFNFSLFYYFPPNLFTDAKNTSQTLIRSSPLPRFSQVRLRLQPL